MNHFLNLLNIQNPSPSDKRDVAIAITVVLFFGILSYSFLSNNAAVEQLETATEYNNQLPEDNTPLTSVIIDEETIGNAVDSKVDTDEDALSQEIATVVEDTTTTSIKAVVLDEIEQRIIEDAMYSVEFEKDIDKLKRSSRPSLFRIAKILKKYPDYQLTIVVYGKGANTQLYNNRAKSCVDYLVNEQIDRNRISYKGKHCKNKDKKERVAFLFDY